MAFFCGTVGTEATFFGVAAIGAVFSFDAVTIEAALFCGAVLIKAAFFCSAAANLAASSRLAVVCRAALSLGDEIANRSMVDE